MCSTIHFSSCPNYSQSQAAAVKFLSPQGSILVSVHILWYKWSWWFHTDHRFSTLKQEAPGHTSRITVWTASNTKRKQQSRSLTPPEAEYCPSHKHPLKQPKFLAIALGCLHTQHPKLGWARGKTHAKHTKFSWKRVFPCSRTPCRWMSYPLLFGTGFDVQAGTFLSSLLLSLHRQCHQYMPGSNLPQTVKPPYCSQRLIGGARAAEGHKKYLILQSAHTALVQINYWQPIHKPNREKQSGAQLHTPQKTLIKAVLFWLQPSAKELELLFITSCFCYVGNQWWFVSCVLAKQANHWLPGKHWLQMGHKGILLSWNKVNEQVSQIACNTHHHILLGEAEPTLNPWTNCKNDIQRDDSNSWWSLKTKRWQLYNISIKDFMHRWVPPSGTQIHHQWVTQAPFSRTQEFCSCPQQFSMPVTPQCAFRQVGSFITMSTTARWTLRPCFNYLKPPGSRTLGMNP